MYVCVSIYAYIPIDTQIYTYLYTYTAPAAFRRHRRDTAQLSAGEHLYI